MKKTTVVGLAIATLAAAASMSAWAQPQSDASAPAGAQSASGAAAPASRQTDRALRRKVYAAIVKDKSINAGNISVRAKSGAVTLTGTVSDPAQVGKVEEIVKSVPGVTSVTNKLTVQKPLGGM